MIICKNRESLFAAFDNLKLKKSEIGFVPTMGALHKGHLALINRAKSENKTVVCSVYVNPTQFNDKKDLENYPRTIENDIRLLEQSGCHVLFLPSTNEMYPEGDQLLDTDLNGLDKTMEGEMRPGHFLGMITIVDKLLRLINAGKNYFGEKDFQQLAIIKHYVNKQQLPYEIIGCETVRENDGLAFSSRNVLLTPDERHAAPVIYQSLVQAQSTKNSMNPAETAAWITGCINSTNVFRTQYVSIVDAETLHPIVHWQTPGSMRICVAVLASGTRLIDNISL